MRERAGAHPAVMKLGLLVDTIGDHGVLAAGEANHRSRDTAAVSLTGTLAFTIGIAFWLIYGPAF